jgi:hypothetical protein
LKMTYKNPRIENVILAQWAGIPLILQLHIFKLGDLRAKREDDFKKNV